MSDWNLQTNIKAKPGSQGTLFSGGKSQMNPERRWPRGYTPERKRAIGMAMYDVVDHTEAYPKEDRHGDIIPSKAARDVKDALLTSSVPASDVKNLRVHIVDDRGRRFADEVDAEPGRLKPNVRGSYYGQQQGRWRPAEMDVHANAGAFTILHEVGHHASALAGTQHSSYDTVRQRGEEEGFADAYAEKHFPKKPRKPRAMAAEDVQGMDDYEPSYAQVGSRRGDFEDGYHRMRPVASRVPSAHDNERTKKMADLYGQIHGPKQESLF